MRRGKRISLLVALLVCLFTLLLTMKYTNEVSAHEISDEIYASEIVRNQYLVVKKIDGSEEETLVNLTEMLKLYGEDGKIAVVPNDYDASDCTVISTTDELVDNFGLSGKIFVTDGVKEEFIGNVSDLGGNCETNGKIVVIADEEIENPDQVSICTIGQLVLLS